MNAVTRENDLMHVIYAAQHLLSKLASYTISVLTLVKNLLYVLTAAAVLCTAATATGIRSVVGARGSRSMKSVWSVIYRLKALILDVRS